MLFDFLTDNTKKADSVLELKGESPLWKEIVNCTVNSKIASLKQVLNLFSELGYHNLWGESYKNFPSVSTLLKSLEVKVLEE